MPPEAAGTVIAVEPPGPTGYPLVGVYSIARRDPLRFFGDCVRRYGDLVSMRLGTHDAYLVIHPDHVKHVLQDHASAFAKGPPASRVRTLFGESLTVLDGDGWRQRRRQVQPAFQPGIHAHFLDAATRATEAMLDRWHVAEHRGEPVEVATEMRQLAQAVIIRAVFGEIASTEVRALGHALDVAVTYSDRRLWSPFGWLVRTPAGARYRRALDAIAAFAVRRIAEARDRGAPQGSMLAALLDEPEPASRRPLSDDELRDECLAFLVAGHTTTATALAWTWLLLSANPRVREQVEQASCAVLGGRAPRSGDLIRLDVVRRVIDESLRLYPPTWLTARTPLAETVLGRFPLRPGALLLLSPYLTHRHPAFWEDPERFDPDRFTRARGTGRPAFAYFPFGGGPRRCIGSTVAVIEMLAIVAQVAQRYRLDLLPGARVVTVAGLTLRPHPAVPMRLGRTSRA